LQFVDQEQTNRYDSITSRRITKPKHIDLGTLRSLGSLGSLNELLEVVGLIDYMNMTKPVFERLCWEFLSSFKVNWTTLYQINPSTSNSAFLIRPLRPT